MRNTVSTAVALQPLPEPPMSAPRLDEVVSKVSAQRTEFARLPVSVKVRLLDACRVALEAAADDWVQLVMAAQGLQTHGTEAAEEWLAGPMPVARHLRRLAESLSSVARTGRAPLGTAIRPGPNGDPSIEVFPADPVDSLLWPGLQARLLLPEGTDLHAARAGMAAFYKEKDASGGLSVVLGSGASTAGTLLDALDQLFVHGRVTVVKTSPVNNYLTVVWEAALKPLVAPGFLRFASGGPEAGQHLASHARVDAVHLTGSRETHDRIAWGPPGPEHDKRRAQNTPLQYRPFTAGLGGVTPVLVTPGDWQSDELAVLGRTLAAACTGSGGGQCHTPQILVLPDDPSLNRRLLGTLRHLMGRATTRRAAHPATTERWKRLQEGQPVEKFGADDAGRLPWTLLTGLSPGNFHPLFTTEAGSPLIGVVTVPQRQVAHYLAAAVEFVNTEVAGQLCAAIFAPRSLLETPEGKAAVDTAVMELKRGVVSVNAPPGVGSWLASPWGPSPGGTLAEAGSGRGWRHDSLLLAGIGKVVWTGDLLPARFPPWVQTGEAACRLARALFHVAVRPLSVGRVASALAASLWRRRQPQLTTLPREALAAPSTVAAPPVAPPAVEQPQDKEVVSVPAATTEGQESQDINVPPQEAETQQPPAPEDSTQAKTETSSPASQPEQTNAPAEHASAPEPRPLLRTPYRGDG